MRISVLPADPGYRTYKTLPRNVKARVFVDGMEQKACITADTKTGYVLVVEMDEAGNVQLRESREHVRLKQMCGNVEIEIVSNKKAL